MAGERESSARRSATSSVVVVVLELASMIFAGLSGVMAKIMEASTETHATSTTTTLGDLSDLLAEDSSTPQKPSEDHGIERYF